MIPLNGHVQIIPVEQDTFISSSKTAYEEIGTIVSLDQSLPAEAISTLRIGGKVYFDSWMATKYPDGKGGFYWLVPYESIRAYEPVSSESL